MCIPGWSSGIALTHLRIRYYACYVQEPSELEYSDFRSPVAWAIERDERRVSRKDYALRRLVSLKHRSLELEAPTGAQRQI